jgi:hypothetical protein
LTFACLYHRTDRTDTSVEDILQKAFGGKKTSSTLICKDCNNQLGNTIDRELAKSLEWVTNLIDPVGRRKDAPTLKNVEDQDGNKWHVAPGGKPSVPYQSIGPTTWKGDVSQLEMAKKNAEAKAKAMGIDNPVIEVRHERTQAGPMPFKLQIENQIAFRSACKSALELLALVGFDDDDRRSELLLDARNFVKNGDAYTPVGWLENSVLDDVFNSFEHYILLAQSEDLSVYWEFILYGGIVAVSGRFAPIKKKIGGRMYRICPRTGESFDGAVELGPISKDLVTWSTVTTPALQHRTNCALQKLSLAVMTNALLDELPAEIDQMEPAEQNKHIQQTAVKLVEQAVAAISQATGRDPKEVLTLIYQQMVRG